MRRLKVEFPDPPGVVKPVCSSDSELKVVSTITVANFNPKQSYVAVPKGRKPVRRLVQVRCFGSRQPITRPSINSPVRSFRRPSAVLRHGNTGTGTAADIGADVILAQHLDDAPEWRVGVDDEVLKAVGAADHRRLRQHFYTVAADHDAVEPANLTLGKRLGAREGLALGLTLGGVALAARNSANAK